MGRSALTQAGLAAQPVVRPIYLIDWTVGAYTLHMADQDFTYQYGSTVIQYSSYLLGVSGIGEIIDVNGSPSNANVTLEIANDRWSTYAYLYLLNDVTSFLRTSVTIYRLNRNDTVSVYPSDVRVTEGKWVIEEVLDITEQSFTLRCSSRLYDKRNAWNSGKITRNLYPEADPNDIGKTRNVVYGDCEKVRCHSVYTGGIDTLAADITFNQMYFYASGVAQIPFPLNNAYVYVQIDDEIINVNFTSSTVGSVIQRGASGTTRTAHKKGAAISRYMYGYYHYEVAAHPVNTILNVFVDDIRQILYPASGYTVRAYTGKAGDELSGYSSRAMLEFSLNPMVKKQINVEATAEHGHSTDVGSHSHSASYTSIMKYPTGASARIGPNGSIINGTSAANVADGNDASYSECYISSAGGAGSYVGVNVTFDGYSYGSISYANVWVKFDILISSTHLNVYYNGSAIASVTGNLDDGWYRYTVTNPALLNWGAGLIVQIQDVGSTQAKIFECKIEYFYSPTVSASPATGVAASVSTASILQGLTTADIVIGEEVTVDVQGIMDDASGTITGSPNHLIELPAQAIKHFLVARCGLSIDDMGTSFNSAAGQHNNNGPWVFAFVAHDIGEDAQQIAHELARQCRCRLYEYGGKFELSYIPDSYGSASITLSEDEIFELPRFSMTSTRDAANKISCFYRRDYRTRRANGDATVYGISADAQAAGYMDMLSASTGAGDIEKKLYLKAVRASAFADSMMDWELARLATPERFIEIEMAWRGTLATPLTLFRFNDRMTGDHIYEVISYKPEMDAGKVALKGRRVA